MEQLIPKHNIKDLRNALKSLPKTSDQIYEQAMERLQNQDSETVSLANRTLKCVIGAVRFLHIRELQHALAVREGDYDIDDEALTAPNHLLSICAGLLTIDEKDGVIRLVHYTAQEFFKAKEHRYFSDTQQELTSICLTYLSLGVFEVDLSRYTKVYTKRHALLQYAATNLGEHALGGIKGANMRAAVKLFSNKSNVAVAAKVALLAEYPGARVALFHLPDDFTGIHYASYLGFADVIGQLNEQSCEEIDLQDSWGRSSLSWAAERGHNAVVRLLLETNKVDLNSKDRYGRTPLSYAAGNGHKAMVMLLLGTNNVDLDSKDSFGQTPLIRAAGSGHEVVVMLLLEILETNEVDLDSKDSSGRTPLTYAALRRHEALVLLLEKDKADLDSIDEFSRRIHLSYAPQLSDDSEIRVLLMEGKLNIHSEAFNGWTPGRRVRANSRMGLVELPRDNDKIDVVSEDFDS